MNIERYLQLELVGELRDELIHIVLVLIVIILDRLLQPLEEVEGQLILLVDTIDNHNSLLKLGVSDIVVLQDR